MNQLYSLPRIAFVCACVRVCASTKQTGNDMDGQQCVSSKRWIRKDKVREHGYCVRRWREREDERIERLEDTRWRFSDPMDDPNYYSGDEFAEAKPKFQLPKACIGGKKKFYKGKGSIDDVTVEAVLHIPLGSVIVKGAWQGWPRSSTELGSRPVLDGDWGKLWLVWSLVEPFLGSRTLKEAVDTAVRKITVTYSLRGWGLFGERMLGNKVNVDKCWMTEGDCEMMRGDDRDDVALIRDCEILSGRGGVLVVHVTYGLVDFKAMNVDPRLLYFVEVCASKISGHVAEAVVHVTYSSCC